MRVLIVGFGSIAKKHLEVLSQLVLKPTVYALRSNEGNNVDSTVISVYSWQEVPQDLDFIIISNPTSKHLETILKAAEYKVPLFIEKPPLMNLAGVETLLACVSSLGVVTYTAFNLRFHPVLVWLKDYIANKRILEVQAYCGSYLPSWRPDTDYRDSYSANKKLGGGVHLDLIHEVDYLCWLIGSRPIEVISKLERLSTLEIDSYDSAFYYLKYENTLATICLNYFRKDPKRTLEIVFEDHSLMIDLINNVVSNSSGEVVYSSNHSSLYTYTEQMKYFMGCIENNEIPINSLQESIETLKISLGGIG